MTQTNTAAVPLAELAQRNVGLAYAEVKRFWRFAAGRALELSDLENTALLALHRAAATWRPSGAAFSTYGTAAVRRELAALVNARRHRPWQPLPVDENGEQLDPEDVRGEEHDAGLLAEENKRRVAELLRQLHPRYRQAVVLVVAQGWSLRDAGRHLGGMSGEAVRQLVARGLEKLRRAAGVEPAADTPRKRRRARQAVGAGTAPEQTST
jgi:RNA polymerase sigma factor (sigma-70 family)